MADVARLGKLHPRYVTEILGCLACADFVAYSPDHDAYAIDPAQAKVLADATFPLHGAGWFDMVPALYQAIPGVAGAASTPGKLTGVPFSDQSEWGFGKGMHRCNAPGIKAAYTRKWLLRSVPHVVGALEAGIKVADLGTGMGAVAFALANSFPNSTVTGIDLDAPSIHRANTLNPGLANLKFRCMDSKDIEPDTFDLITNHDCIHDLVDPVGVLRSVRAALKPGGVFFSMEPRTAGETMQENFAAAQAGGALAQGAVAMQYGLSTLHCASPARLCATVPACSVAFGLRACVRSGGGQGEGGGWVGGEAGGGGGAS